MTFPRSLVAAVVVGCSVLVSCGTDPVTVTASTAAGAGSSTLPTRSIVEGTSTSVDTSPGASPSVSAVDPTSATATVSAPTVAPTSSGSASVRRIVLSATSLGIVDLGASKEDTVSAVSSVLGQPASVIERQPSFSSFGSCPGTFVEAVSWGDLLLLFGDGADEFAPGGVRHLFNWSVSSDAPDGPRNELSLANGIALGSTVAQVEKVYDDGELITEDEVFGPSFAVGGSPGIFGTTTGTADDDTVVYLEGGIACGE